MGTVVVGLSHRSAPVTIRERAAFSREELPRALEQLAGMQGITEALILSTCNRVELLVCADREEEAVPAIKFFLHNYHALGVRQLDPFLYEFRSAAAIRHIFRVACGLDSLVIGESQILGQIRDAYNTAMQVGCIGSNLNRLMLHTFQVAKQVRGATGISTAGWSVSRAAVEFASQIFGDLSDRTILVVGAGKMSELTTSHLHRSGAQKVLVTNRTYERAAQLAARFHGETVAFENLGGVLARADIVISSTASLAGYVIRRTDVERSLGERPNRPLLFIDIAVPRNVEPTISDLKNVHLCDIDALNGIGASHEREVGETIRAAEQMVQTAADGFSNHGNDREIGRVIMALKSRIQSIGCAELERQIGKLTNASPEDRQRLELMVKRIANKILHPLIVQLKRQASSSFDKLDYVETLTLVLTANDEGRLERNFDQRLPGKESTRRPFETGGSPAVAA